MSGFGDVERGHENYGEGKGENLTVFEKTWGHRLLLGMSICMFIGGLIMAIYCALHLRSAGALIQDSATYAFAYAIYLTGLIMGGAVLPPALLGIFTAAHPRLAVGAIAAAIVGLVLDIAFIVYAAMLGGQVFSIALYAVLFGIAPVVYLVAAVKVRRSIGVARND